MHIIYVSVHITSVKTFSYGYLKLQMVFLVYALNKAERPFCLNRKHAK